MVTVITGRRGTNMKFPAQNEPASSAAIDELKVCSPVSLPSSFIELLLHSNGGEWSLPVQPLNLCLNSVEEIIRTISELTHEEHFPGFLVFGSNGGGVYTAIDHRGNEPWAVVALDACNSNISESRTEIASNFDRFVELIGKVELTGNAR